MEKLNQDTLRTPADKETGEMSEIYVNRMSEEMHEL